jgi:hypothetical protein
MEGFLAVDIDDDHVLIAEKLLRGLRKVLQALLQVGGALSLELLQIEDHGLRLVIELALRVGRVGEHEGPHLELKYLQLVEDARTTGQLAELVELLPLSIRTNPDFGLFHVDTYDVFSQLMRSDASFHNSSGGVPFLAVKSPRNFRSARGRPSLSRTFVTFSAAGERADAHARRLKLPLATVHVFGRPMHIHDH